VTRRPDFFIIGAPKSGTTSLYYYLAGHPDVYMSPVKEPFYFSADVRAGLRSGMRYGQDEQKYLNLFAEASGEKRLGEASTSYLVSRVAPANIKRFNPEARAIAILRNPVELVYALHNERVSQGAEDVLGFEEALSLDDERREGTRLPAGASPLGAVYRDTALFGQQLERWRHVFDPAQLHVIVFDDFARDTPTEFRKVLEFLGIDADYAPDTFEVRNPSHRLRGGVLRALMQSRPTQFMTHRVMPRLIGENTALRMRQRARHSRVYRQPNPRPPMADSVRRRLQEDFRPDVELLGTILERDLASEWLNGRTAG
jgi:hypothetical protein